MPRRVFYSFNYNEDRDRVAQVRNMGVVEGSPIASDNDWETIKRGGWRAIKSWIDRQMVGTSCCVVLAGRWTANREWINYELVEAWNQKKGIVVVHIYELKDLNSRKSSRGANPLEYVQLSSGALLSSVAKAYDSPFVDSKDVYADIRSKLPGLIEEAITIRNTSTAHGSATLVPRANWPW
jgi:hypothetical protein